MGYMLAISQGDAACVGMVAAVVGLVLWIVLVCGVRRIAENTKRIADALHVPGRVESAPGEPKKDLSPR